MCLKLFTPENASCRQTLDCLPPDDQAYKDKVYERLMSRYEADHATDCMIFLGCWTEKGVGRVRVGQRVYNIAKVAAWVFHGVPLFGPEFSYHTCQNPACFNPEHIGTKPTISLAFAARYHARRRRHGDVPLAARPGRRLNYAMASTIRERLLAGESAEALASQHGVSLAAIVAIGNGKAWRPKSDTGKHERATRRAA